MIFIWIYLVGIVVTAIVTLIILTGSDVTLNEDHQRGSIIFAVLWPIMWPLFIAHLLGSKDE